MEGLEMDSFESLWQSMTEGGASDPQRIVIFTGAGVSTLSGIKDFRGNGGLYSQPWHGHDVEEILSLHAFMRHPEIFYGWAREFCYCLDRFSPNLVHKVVRDLELDGLTDGVITQNIDVLHQKAGSRKVYEIHGSPAMHHCLKCRASYDYEAIAPKVMRGEVPRCHCGGLIKPDIVFYGESLDEALLEKCFEMASRCSLMIVLGSSLTVQPAASLPVEACHSQAELCIVNRQPTPLDRAARWRFEDLEEFAKKLDVKLRQRRGRKA